MEDRGVMKSKIIGYVAFSFVVITLVVACFANTTPDSFARRIVSTFVMGDSPYRDQLSTQPFLEMLSSEGNLLLRFVGFDETKPRAPRGMVVTAYHRYSYALYPMKVFVADRTTVINDGTDIIGSNFDPDEEWLDRNDVRSVVEIEYAPEKGVHFRFKKR